MEIPHWTEEDGTEVWLVAGDGRGPIGDLADREGAAGRTARAGAVLGANADADDAERIRQLREAGYSRTLSVVELARTTDPPIAATRPDLAIRTARADDAAAMHELTARVWRGRAYFVMPELEAYEGWLARADLDLFLLAFDGAGLIGYVAAEPDGEDLRLDDVQVDPGRRREGIATELVGRALAAGRAREMGRAVLRTEGDDPVGARSFYERLGFRLVREELRFRKPA